MNWVDETRRHEGYVAAVLADGSEPDAPPEGRKVWWTYNGADGPRAVAVRGACECGWRGAETHPIHWGDDEATEAYEERTGPFADWEYHVTVTEGAIPPDVEQMIADLRRRVEELSERQQVTALRVTARLEEAAPKLSLTAVAAARSGLVPWEAIGRAFGVSRQAAHERFAHRVKD